MFQRWFSDEFPAPLSHTGSLLLTGLVKNFPPWLSHVQKQITVGNLGAGEDTVLQVRVKPFRLP